MELRLPLSGPAEQPLDAVLRRCNTFHFISFPRGPHGRLRLPRATSHPQSIAPLFMTCRTVSCKISEANSRRFIVEIQIINPTCVYYSILRIFLEYPPPLKWCRMPVPSVPICSMMLHVLLLKASVIIHLTCIRLEAL